MNRPDPVDTRTDLHAPAQRGRRRLCAGAAALLATIALARPAAALEEVPYVKTPDAVVDAILTLASVGPRDYLIDLGSGDGRIVIAAARRHGTRGLGIEIDPSLVELSSTRAAEVDVSALAQFRTQDLFETDLSGASVVTLYLLPDVNLALRPRLLAMLAPGTRVVSHDWDMGDWQADRSVTVPVPDKPVGWQKQSVLRLWVIPAWVDGEWTSRVDGVASPSRLAIRQHFQEVSATWDAGRGKSARRGGEAADRRGAAATGRLDGERIRIVTMVRGRPAILEGTVTAGRIDGVATIGTRTARWQAIRNPSR